MTQPQITEQTVRQIANLARLDITPQEASSLKRELNGILAWVDELNGIKTDGVEPLASVEQTTLPLRKDEITDGDCADAVVKNAPNTQDHFFLVPKVIE